MVDLVRVYSEYSNRGGLTVERARSWLEQARAAEKPAPAAKPRSFSVARQLGEESCNEIAYRYEAGATARALATAFEVSQESLLAMLRKRGVKIRQQSPTDEQRAQLVRGYESGMTITELEARYGISHGSVWRALKKAGVSMRPKGKSATRR